MRDLFPRQFVFRRSARLPHSADAVWRMVGDFGNAAIGKGAVERIDVEGEGIGRIRTLHIAGGIGTLRERLEEHSDADRYYVYRVIDGGPVNFANYLAMAAVMPCGAGASILTWITMADAVEGHDDEVRAMLQGNIDLVLQNVRDGLAA